MQLNIPPRLLRVVAGCAAGTLVLVLTLSVLMQKRDDRSAGSTNLPSFSDNVTLPALTEQKPHWTTEQLEPKFAYVQYATDLDYLCNAVSAIDDGALAELEDGLMRIRLTFTDYQLFSASTIWSST